MCSLKIVPVAYLTKVIGLYDGMLGGLLVGLHFSVYNSESGTLEGLRKVTEQPPHIHRYIEPPGWTFFFTQQSF